ncbi:MAG: hypothetical protein U9R25_13250 [Chloroflexota bacterium]|nr:hypothetical protein [Chloroflexota bacterium]
MKLVGVLLKINHDLRHHHWMAAPLDRWMAIATVVIAGLIAIRWLPGGINGITICGILLLIMLVAQSISSRLQYVIFRSEQETLPVNPNGDTLDPSDKQLLRVTGLFEVEGKKEKFTELLAYFRSFETREHALMAIVPPSSVLLFGNWPDHEIGMWYIFFKNSELRRIEPGMLIFGTSQRPALRIAVEQDIPPNSSPMDVWGGYRNGKKKKPKVRKQILFLSFESEVERQLILEDLLADAGELVYGG